MVDSKLAPASRVAPISDSSPASWSGVARLRSLVEQAGGERGQSLLPFGVEVSPDLTTRSNVTIGSSCRSTIRSSRPLERLRRSNRGGW